MRNKRIIIGIGIGFVAALALLVFLLSPSPEKNLKKYISDWQKKDYKAMYQLLSSDAKGKYAEDAFMTKYKNIDSGIGLSKLEVKNIDKNNIKKDKNGRTIVPYTLTMETDAGPIEFPYQAALVKKGMAYKIDWSESLIFPQMSEGDVVKVSTLFGDRGEILDRNGKKLAANGEVYSAGFATGKIVNQEEAQQQFSAITGISIEEIEKDFNSKWVQDAIKAKKNVFVSVTKFSMDETNKKDALDKISGVVVNKVPSRVYPYKEAAAHLTGYLGSISKEELEKLKSEGYTETDVIGKTGLERSFEKRLRAQNGVRIYIKSADGVEKDTIKEKKAVNGETVKLTIDIDMQLALYGEMNGDSGAATAINPKTGEVLALASSPAYDPNRFILGFKGGEYEALESNPEKPLIAKYGDGYVPGSALKPITAAIGLKTGTIKTDYKMVVSGLTWQDNPSWGNYEVTRVTDPKKPVDLREALIYSDNIYFAKAALDIGGENFINESKNFGIGESIEFPLSIASSQLVNKEGFGSGRSIALADTGYGQGKVLISPFQLAYMYTPFVNNGNMIKPVLEDKEEKSKVWHENAVSPENSKIILDDLIQVIDNANGTGYGAKIPGVSLAGKTGTAELKAEKNGAGPELGWFTLVNTDEPKLLITMMIMNVENRNGSHYVVPKVKRVMEKFIK